MKRGGGSKIIRDVLLGKRSVACVKLRRAYIRTCVVIKMDKLRLFYISVVVAV